MATYDYRVTVTLGGPLAPTVGVYEVTAGRPALAIARALDTHQRAHRGAQPARVLIECIRLGVHKRPPCGTRCGRTLEYGADPYGAPTCGRPCAGLANHTARHDCGQHAPTPARSMDPFAYGAPGVPDAPSGPAYLAIGTEGVTYAQFPGRAPGDYR